ncbi:hypothetical protein ILUMI_22010 [Ignelater luminosus]|uniref:Uncharacterized protein n=1 Tax=Ignelater luminosus TaxID=2038154 RepID=A0A8K0CBF0_IGNLU|nr:hypothetical protein ILUMI_22010 [Ignelater luminosus]
MVLTTEEKVFTAEHYFHLYTNGRDNDPSLKQVSEKDRQEFNKAAPSKSVMLTIVETFCHTGKKPLHSERVTIWCAVSGHGIIGPYLVEREDEHPITVNQEHNTFCERFMKFSSRTKSVGAQAMVSTGRRNKSLI